MAKDGEDSKHPAQPAIPGLKGHNHSVNPETARRRIRASALRDKNRAGVDK